MKPTEKKISNDTAAAAAPKAPITKSQFSRILDHKRSNTITNKQIKVKTKKVQSSKIKVLKNFQRKLTQ